MIDLHCHALPGVDDGPPDMPAAIALVRAAGEAGVGTIVATPHVDHTFGMDADRRDHVLADLRAALGTEGIAVEVLPGAELAIDRFLDLEDAERDRLRIGGGPYWLLESPLSQSAPPFDDYLLSLLTDGAQMVLAHPERCPTFMRAPGKLARLVDAGALTSVTAGAFTGRFGGTVQRFAFDLLYDGLVHSVASDAHNTATRPPGLRAELEEAGLGDLVAWLTEEVPCAVLVGDAPPPMPGLPPRPSPPGDRGRLRRILGR